MQHSSEESPTKNRSRQSPKINQLPLRWPLSPKNPTILNQNRINVDNRNTLEKAREIKYFLLDSHFLSPLVTHVPMEPSRL